MDNKKHTKDEILEGIVEATYNFNNNNTDGQFIQKIYALMEKTLTNIKNKGIYTQEEYEELLNMSKRATEILSKPEVIKAIKSDSNFTIEEFMKKYKVAILGEAPTVEDTQRKAEITDLLGKSKSGEWQLDQGKPMQESVQKEQNFNVDFLYNESYIKDRSETRGTTKIISKALEYKPMSLKVYNYPNKKGQSVTIKEIGKIIYDAGTFVKEPYVTEYEIITRDRNGNTTKRRIYSNIKSEILLNEEYKRAVLDGLLSEENIAKSKTCSYVGEIVLTPEDMKQDKGKKEKGTYLYPFGHYCSKINNNYSIEYKAAALSAVKMYEQHINNKRKDEDDYTR